jgi:hypothetical protein
MICLFESVRADEISSGSGFFVSPTGHILTNHHVIDGADEIVAILSDGQRLHAQVVLENSGKDVAILKVSVSEVSSLTLGTSSEIDPLDDVVAFGYPLVGALGIELSAYQGKINAWRDLDGQPRLQMDANINAGASGGPVVKLDGTVIGLTVSQLNPLYTLRQSGSMAQGIKFAIPIDEVKSLLKGLAIDWNPGTAPASNLKLFEQVKPAMVLVVSKASTEIGKTKGADATTSVPQRQAQNPLVAFVKQFVAAGGGDDIEKVLPFYADSVAYFDDGIISRARIESDVTEHFRKWPMRSYKIQDEPVIRSRSDGSHSATYVSLFEVSDQTKSISGKVSVELIIDSSPKFQIKAIKETVLTRQTTKAN